VSTKNIVAIVAKSLLLLLLPGFGLPAIAQDNVESVHANSITGFLKRGQFDLHARTFYMSTINRRSLTDYSALAAGAGIGYYSPYLKNFRLGMSGFFIFRFHENNLDTCDPATGANSRYETTLFDMHDPANQTDLDRLEELFIEYNNSKWQFILGRQKIHTPLLNEQDNRMRPNLFSGLSGSYKIGSFTAEGGLITGVTPRGTVSWYSIEDSFGVYPFGRNIYGEPSDYKNNISSLGLGYIGLKYNTPTVHYELWDYFVENVFNLSFAQADAKLPVDQSHILLGAQAIYQTAINNGGNPDSFKSFIYPGEQTWAFGLRAGISRFRHQLTMNYLGISNQGRFLFPREWGREIFYASLPRERYEGNGGLHAVTTNYEYKSDSSWPAIQLGVGYVNTQDVITKPRLNKYGMPSYFHFAGGVTYNFHGWAEGIGLRILAVHKMAQRPNQITDDFRINRVDLWNLNVIFNYTFSSH
jgi:hypothetical protein